MSLTIGLAKSLRQIIRGPLEFVRIAGYHPITYTVVVTFNILFALLQTMRLY